MTQFPQAQNNRSRQIGRGVVRSTRGSREGCRINGWVKSRTALCNQLRGLLRERGVVVRTGAAALKRSLPAALADESSELSDEMRELLCEMSQWLRTLEQRIASCEARITRKFKHDERCQRLAPVRGWVR